MPGKAHQLPSGTPELEPETWWLLDLWTFMDCLYSCFRFPFRHRREKLLCCRQLWNLLTDHGFCKHCESGLLLFPGQEQAENTAQLRKDLNSQFCCSRNLLPYSPTMKPTHPWEWFTLCSHLLNITSNLTWPVSNFPWSYINYFPASHFLWHGNWTCWAPELPLPPL